MTEEEKNSVRYNGLISDQMFRQFLSYNDIDLLEMFDANIKTFDTDDYQGAFDFEQSFILDNRKYTFMAKITGEHARIGFFTNGDISTSIISTSQANKVFAGIFECVKKLLMRKKITSFEFNTDIKHKVPRDPNNLDKGFRKTVIDIYDSDRFKKYIKERFKFDFDKKVSVPGGYSWGYILPKKIAESPKGNY